VLASVKADAALSLHAAALRVPEGFVQLELEADIQLVLQNPGRDIRGLNPAKNRRKENRFHPLGEREPAHLLPRPLVVFAGTDHKLHLIARGEVVDIRPQIAGRFAAAGRF